VRPVSDRTGVMPVSRVRPVRHTPRVNDDPSDDASQPAESNTTIPSRPFDDPDSPNPGSLVDDYA
jgi:hypothetical protein